MAQNVAKFKASNGSRFFMTGLTSRGFGLMGPFQKSGGIRTVYAKGFDPETPNEVQHIEVDILFGKEGYTKPGINPKTGEPYPTVTWEYVGSESVGSRE